MKLRLAVGTALFGGALASLLLAACGAEPEGGVPPSPAAPGEQVQAAEPAEEAATPAPAMPTSQPARRLRANGLPVGVKPYRGVDSPRRTNVAAQCNNPKLSYFSGPIVMSPVIVPVFWSSHVNAALTAPTTGIAQFFADVTQSTTYWPWLTEYDTVGLTGGSEQSILPGSATAGVTLVPSRCASTTNCTVTDAEVQTELTNQINAKVLPAPTLDCTGNVQTIYMIEFPPNVTVQGPGIGDSCVQFCAYHNTGTYGTNAVPLIYGVLADEFTGTCKTGCGTNATALENATSTASHELVEAVTDPDIGLDLQANYAAPAGWGDNNNDCGEIADICDNDGKGDTITVSGRTWTVQELWSNKQGQCTSTGTALPVCSGTTLTNCRLCSCGDDGGACSGNTSVCETTSTNVLFGGCEQCTSLDDTCTGGSTCQQSTTPAKDDICACTPITACPAGDNCGTISNGCGGTLSCGTCAAPQTCGGGTPSNPNVCGCTPITACPAGDNCGTISNGCGGTISCGAACAAPQTCGGGGTPNVCGCTPATTCPAGDNCGTVPNGCGGTVSCGTCSGTQTCANNVCSACVPITSCPAGDNCGTISNGCGGTISCGAACASPQTCGGGGTPNVCGCTALAACPAGSNCGTLPNGCGGTLLCGGACSSPQTCGGGGTANVCGCSPLTACPAGSNCGTLPDGCGGTLNCGGACTAPQSCGGGGTPNVCGGCVPATSCPGGQNCGTASDGCGGTLDCGTCVSPQTCGGGGTGNVCGCTSLNVCPAGDNCGSVPDGCGGIIPCGTCDPGQVCQGNTCVAGGSSSSSGGASSSGTTSSGGASSSSGTTSSGGASSSSGGASSSGTTSSGGASSSGTTSSGGASSSSGGASSSGTTSSGGASSSSGTTSSGGSSSGAGGGSTGGSSGAGGGSAGGSSGAGGGSSSGGGSGTGGGISFGSSSGSGTGGGAGGGSGNGGSGNGNGGSGVTGTPGQKGGCNCETAGDPVDTSPVSLSAFGMLALAGVIRSRKRRSA
jgi:hypothetical protein